MSVSGPLRPIFVHASPRSGSTYFFNVLRRLEPLLCFNETLIDIFGGLSKEAVVGERGAGWDPNHHFLAQHDFQEFVAAWDSVMPRYPATPAYRGFLPPGGVLDAAQQAYLAGFIEYARQGGRRPVLCEIYSQGRAGALRDAFGGYHVAQLRDPLSQWGSFYRPLEEAHLWTYLADPVLLLGLNGEQPLYRLLPEAWRVPVLPWPEDDRWERWQTQLDYIGRLRTPGPEGLERGFRWHMLAWTLDAIAATAYADLVLDIDRLHDAVDYRAGIVAALQAEIGLAPDFSDIERFPRYYDFEGLDMAAVCREVLAELRRALADGSLAAAVSALAVTPPTIPVGVAAVLVFDKAEAGLAAMLAAPERRQVSLAQWAETVRTSRLRWENRTLRGLARRAEPLLRLAKRVRRRA